MMQKEKKRMRTLKGGVIDEPDVEGLGLLPGGVHGGLGGDHTKHPTRLLVCDAAWHLAQWHLADVQLLNLVNVANRQRAFGRHGQTLWISLRIEGAHKVHFLRRVSRLASIETK